MGARSASSRTITGPRTANLERDDVESWRQQAVEHGEPPALDEAKRRGGKKCCPVVVGTANFIQETRGTSEIGKRRILTEEVITPTAAKRYKQERPVLPWTFQRHIHVGPRRGGAAGREENRSEPGERLYVKSAGAPYEKKRGDGIHYPRIFWFWNPPIAAE